MAGVDPEQLGTEVRDKLTSLLPAGYESTEKTGWVEPYESIAEVFERPPRIRAALLVK